VPLLSRQIELRLVLAVCLGLVCGCQSGPLSRFAMRRESEPVITDEVASTKERPAEKPSKVEKPASSERKRPPSIADRLKTKKPDGLDDPEKSKLLDLTKTVETEPLVAESNTESQPKTAVDKVPPEIDEAAESEPEIELASGQQEVVPKSKPESGTPAVEISQSDEASEPETDEPLTEVEAEAEERRAIDAIKIWPQGKRDGKSFSERLNAKLTPPWTRDTAPELPPYKKKGERAATPPKDAPPVIETPVRTDPKADFWQDELRKVISLMEAEAARPPEDDSPAEKQAHIQRQVYLRMLYLMAAEPEKAQLPLMNVEPTDQEFWTCMFWGMSNYFADDPNVDPAMRAAQTIAQLQSAARQLQAIADLEVRNVNFCQQIDGWGLYDRFDRDEFDAGQAVLLYCELRNFHSEQTVTGYRTRVSSIVYIVRAGDEETVLERFDLGEVEDQCRGLRTDFYNSYQINIPAKLTSGAYRLRLTIEDRLSGRKATQTLGFTIR
jgi:hypothetical protein